MTEPGELVWTRLFLRAGALATVRRIAARGHDERILFCRDATLEDATALAFTRIETRFVSIDARLDEMDVRFDRLETRIESLETTIGAIPGDVADLAARVRAHSRAKRASVRRRYTQRK